MIQRPFLVAVLACLLPAAQNVSARQYPPEPPANDEREDVAAPAPEPPAAPSPDGASRPRVVTESLPYSPYPAGLTWVLTPQAFRVPITNRIYYPPHTYVRRCPYFPRGYYWGANWRFNVIGRGNLLFAGTYRYNPYLTAHKAQQDPKLRGQRRYAMPAGPEGQAMLLGAAPSRPPALAKETKSEDAGEDEEQVAAADDAQDEPTTQPTSSRRTARKKERDLR